jgi:hypothetical protein
MVVNRVAIVCFLHREVVPLSLWKTERAVCWPPAQFRVTQVLRPQQQQQQHKRIREG